MAEVTAAPTTRKTQTVLGTGSAPGKIIVLGEHAVVYGQPALAAALDRGVRVVVEKDEEGPRLRAPRWGVVAPLSGEEGSAPLSVALERVRAAVAPELTQVALVAEDRLPLGAGLGSSAALTVASARALAAAAGRELTVDRLTEVVHAAEQVFHGNPSGVDQATVVRGGVIQFQRSPGGTPSIRPVNAARPIPVVVALERPHVGTKEAVEGLRRRRDRHPRTLDLLLGELGALCTEGTAAVEKGDLVTLGELMDLAHGILSALGVSSSDLDGLVQFARSQGALGAKLTGAGVGGAMIALTDGDPDRARQLVLAFRARGASAFACELG
ncbi:MAG: mevalonate kinase [Myxococcota bacterium]